MCKRLAAWFAPSHPRRNLSAGGGVATVAAEAAELLMMGGWVSGAR